MALETELPDRRSFQHFGVARTVWNVTSGAALEFQWCMFENEWALFIRVAFNASYVRADRELGLLRFETAVGVVTVRTSHSALEHFVMERFGELRFLLIMAAKAKLRLTLLQHGRCRLFFDQCHRAGFGDRFFFRVSVVALSTSDIVAPMLAATEVVVSVFCFVASEACVGCGFRIKILKVDDLCLVTATLDVGFAWAVARLAALDLILPALELAKL